MTQDDIPGVMGAPGGPGGARGQPGDARGIYGTTGAKKSDKTAINSSSSGNKHLPENYAFQWRSWECHF